MALTTDPHVGFSQNVATGVANTAASIQPYDNTKAIIIYNPDSTLDLYVGYGTSAAAQLVATNSTRVPPLSAITLDIGVHRRGYETPAANAKGLIFNASGAGPIAVNVTYVNQMPR